MWWIASVAIASPIPGAATVHGPRDDLVPSEVQNCRARGFLWLSDPDYYERTEIETETGWTAVWQVLDRQGGRLGHLLVYPETCRVVAGVETPVTTTGSRLEVIPPPGSTATSAEVAMILAWAGKPTR